MKRKTVRKLLDLLLIVSPVILVLAIWIVSARTKTLNTSIIPEPEDVIDSLKRQIVKGYMTKHISSSFLRVLKGYLFGSVIGLIAGILAALFGPVEKIITAPTGFLRAIPAIALIPFFILTMGIGERSKVAVITFGSMWPVLINTMQGIKYSEKKLLEVGDVLCKDSFTKLRKIIIPGAVPSILTGLRMGSSSAWVCVVAAEMIAASSGLGYLITYSREMADPATLIVGTAALGIFGVIIDFIFARITERLIYWQ